MQGISIQGIHFSRRATFLLSTLALGLRLNHVGVLLKGKLMLSLTSRTCATRGLRLMEATFIYISRTFYDVCCARLTLARWRTAL